MGGRVDSVRDETRAIVLLVEGPGGKPVTHGEDDSWWRSISVRALSQAVRSLSLSRSDRRRQWRGPCGLHLGVEMRSFDVLARLGP